MRLLKFNTIEKGTFGPRHKKVDGLVIHYTATSLPRITSYRTSQEVKYFNSLINRALLLPGLDKQVAANLQLIFDKDQEISDGMRLCIQAAGLPRQASWHYIVSSLPIGVYNDSLMICDGTKVDADVVEFVNPQFQSHHVGNLNTKTNERSIGIENCLPQPLFKTVSENEARCHFENLGWHDIALLKGPDGTKYWYPIPNQFQMNGLFDACEYAIKQYPDDIYWIGGHVLFSRDRIDPDPPFNLNIVREEMKKRFGKEFKPKP